jgi:hypothetical protein
MSDDLKIPSPCDENWDKMPSKDNGRYCGSCERVVIDFSSYTRDEIIEYLNSRNGEKTCGTVRTSALSKNAPSRGNIIFIAAVILAFGTTLFSCYNYSDPQAAIKEDQQESIELMGIIIPEFSSSALKDTLKNAVRETGTGSASDDDIAAPVEDGASGCVVTGEIYIDEAPGIDQKIFQVYECDTLPEYPAGLAGWSHRLHNAIVGYEPEYDGTLYISFVVNADGSTGLYEVLKCNDEGLRELLLKALGEMSDWKPGTVKGKKERVKMTLPLKLRLD